MEINPALRWTRVQGALLDVACGALCGGALGLAVQRLFSLPLPLPFPIALLGAAAGALVATRWTSRRAALALERRRPVLAEALQAFVEGQGGALRPHLRAWIEQRLGLVFLRAAALRCALAGALVAAVALWPHAAQRLARAPPAEPAPVLRVHARVEPPAYSRLPAFEVDGPRVEALRGSHVALRFQTGAAAVRWSEAGQPENSLPTALGAAELALTLAHTRTLRVEASPAAPAQGPFAGDLETAVLLVQLVAAADEPPTVALLEPAADRSVTAAPGRIALRALARDDLAVAEVSLHFTLAHGRGESMRFRSGRVPAAEQEARPGDDADDAARSGESARTGAHDAEAGQAAERTRTVVGTLDPAALGMASSDTLVVWAEARDGNTLDGPGRARSDARIVRWEEPVAPLRGLASAAPLPPPKSLLTERELLARTERLVRAHRRGAALRDASQSLAQDQRSVRSGFGFFLNDEEGAGLALDVDDKELAQAGDTRARKLLAEAVSAMWEAEGALAANTPAAALAPERAAVKALDAAFALVRVSLRPAAPPDKPVDESRRLHGAQAGLAPRPQPQEHAAPPDPALLALARKLLIAAESRLTEPDARALADSLWAAPASDFPSAQLAAQLYAATDAASRAVAARGAGEALARFLRPGALVLPAGDAQGARVVAQVPAR